MMQPLANAVQLEILRDDGRALYILVDVETAERELNAWIEQERRWADSVVEQQQDSTGYDPLGLNDDEKHNGPTFDPNEFYVRQVTGKDPETGRAKTVAYRLHDLTNMMTVQEESETPA